MLEFSSYLADRYPIIKAQYPAEGRRKWKLRAAQEFWQIVSSPVELENPALSRPEESTSSSPNNIAFAEDGDPYDTDVGVGIVIRTDYTNEDAWQAFYSKLQDAEKEFVSDAEESAEAEVEGAMAEANGAMSASEELEDEEDEPEEEDVEMVDDDGAPPAIFSVFNPPGDSGQALHNTSNILALRLFNDVNIVTALTPPKGTQRVKPANVLVDKHGYQETYSGKLLWIYDSRSNVDQSVRLVNQRSDVYGTATGDSWRSRVSFIPELQVNLSSGAMKINFGGEDRWDFQERQRNMAEADTYPI